MSGIAHVNIVLQQSSTVQEAQAARNPSPEQGQMAAAQQQAAKAAAHQEKVPELEQSDSLRADTEADRKKNEQGRQGSGQKKKKKVAVRPVEDTGGLLDTVA